MEIQKIRDFVLSKKKEGSVNIPWDEIEPLIEDHIDFPDKKKRFKMEMKPKLIDMGIDFNVVGSSIRFVIRHIEPSKEKKIKPVEKEIRTAVPTPETNAIDNYLRYADDNPGEGTDFGHDYIFPPEFEFVKRAVEEGTCYPMLVGEASVGKSRMCEEISKRLDRHNFDGELIGKGRPVFRINLEEVEESEDVVGCHQLITNPENGNSETCFIPGILLESWVNGWVLIMDELDRSTKAARKQLNMITEIGGRLMVKTHKGFKFFKKHPDATFIFTANTWGHGDFTGMYDGAEPLNTAWLSRIGPKFELKLNWEVFKEALAQHGLDEKVIHLLFEYGGGAIQAVHSSIEKSKLNESITLRSLIRFARLYPVFGWHFGLETCFVNEFKEFNRDKVRTAITGLLGNNLGPTSDLSVINSEEKQSALRERGL